MNVSKTHSKAGQEVRVLDDQELVLHWLHEAQLRNDENVVSEVDEKAANEPSTPPRRVLTVQYYEEVSPTNTSFSDSSVFDTPKSANRSWDEDPFGDDIPDTASGKDKSVQRQADEDYYESASLASLDPPTEVANDLTEDVQHVKAGQIATTPTLIDPTKPRMTCITSCTQCVLADLPCSRTVPSCSRCKRNGHARVCLLHRQTFKDEIDRLDALSCLKPILLKLREEDDDTWAEKLKVAEELEHSWRAGQDRKNWVFPSLDGLQGDLRSQNKRLSTFFPGEGKGRLTLKELHVVVDGR